MKNVIINEIKINRKFNLGNYESIDITISLSPSKEETFEEFKEKIKENLYKEIKDLKEQMSK